MRSEPVDPTEDVLLQRLLAGDEAAFSQLVTRLHGSLVRVALTFVSSHGAAEEVVQETWLGVLKGLKSFERRSSLKTWIFRILVNRARSRGVRDFRMVNFSALEDPEGEPVAMADRFSAEGRWVLPPAIWPEQNPEDLLLRRETVACLQEAIANLPPGSGPWRPCGTSRGSTPGKCVTFWGSARPISRYFSIARGRGCGGPWRNTSGVAE